MTSKRALEHLQSLDLDAMENEAVNWGWYYDNKSKAESVREDLAIIEQDLEILEILKPRIHLKDSTLRNDSQEVEVSFIEASGFVFKNSEDYKLLKEWLENK